MTPVVENVRERHERHPLVMRHIGAHDGHALVLGDPRGRVIERLVKAIAAARAGLGETCEVLRRRLRVDHRRQRRRVRGDDHIFAQPAFEPEARHAKIRVLVGQLEIARVVGRF